MTSVDITYNDFYTIISVVESKGGGGETTGRLSINQSVYLPSLLGYQIDSTL